MYGCFREFIYRMQWLFFSMKPKTAAKVRHIFYLCKFASFCCLYCPIANAIFQYSKINLLVKDTRAGGGERGFPRKNATQKNEGNANVPPLKVCEQK